MSKKTCARCGKPVDWRAATATRMGTTLYYHHESRRSCYTLSTWAGYPEFEKESKA